MDKIIFTVWMAVISVLLVITYVSAKPSGDMAYTAPETETEYIPPITEPETTANIPETQVAETIAATETEAITEPPSAVSYYNVNLSVEVQDCIIKECGKYNIPPEIVIAMIERESRFNPNSIGDNGNSFGLMQIQPRWHSGRMERLGCTDLLNPIQNVTVGIDYLAEMKNRYGDIAKALTAYNTGSYTGTITNYATAIMARANEV